MRQMAAAYAWRLSRINGSEYTLSSPCTQSGQITLHMEWTSAIEQKALHESISAFGCQLGQGGCVMTPANGSGYAATSSWGK